MPLSSRLRRHGRTLVALLLAHLLLGWTLALATVLEEAPAPPSPAGTLVQWNDAYWLGTPSGLLRFDKSSEIAERVEDIGAVHALLADASRLLALDAHALWVIEPGRRESLALQAHPLQLLRAELGCPCWWIRSETGLWLLQRIGERWNLAPVPGLELSADSRLLLDDGEALWLRDANGIRGLPSRSLLAGETQTALAWRLLAGVDANNPVATDAPAGAVPAGGFWRGAASAAVLALLLAMVQRAVRRRRERRQARLRQEELDQQVQRRTADLEIANRQLRDLADTDALTGVSNRRHFDRLLREGFERAMLTRRPLSVLMIDADHFKGFNDRHGHLAGDEALRALGQCLQSAVRSDTAVARFGGEEFAVIFPGGRREARGLAERLRRVVERECPTTVSIGTATLDAVRDRDEPALLRRADRALYAAKDSGRNRVHADEDLTPAPNARDDTAEPEVAERSTSLGQGG